MTRFQPSFRWMSTNSIDDPAAGAGAADGGGNSGGGNAPPAADAGAGDKPWYEMLASEPLRANPSLQLFKNHDELANAYVSLEKRFGIDPARRIDLPADPADAKAMREVWAKLGLPEKADGYGFKLDDKASDADKAMLGKFTEAAHAAGMPKAMAEASMKFWMEQTAAADQARADAFTAQAAEGKAALQKEWGGAYDQKAKEIGQALVKYGDADLVAELDGDKLGNYPNLARMIGKMLDRMAEPNAAGGEGGDADRGARALTPNQAKAAVSVLESDPVKGKALRDAAHPMHKAVVAERLALLAQTEAKAA